MKVHSRPGRRMIYSLPLLEEPPNMRGLLFLQDPGSGVEVLKYSGETDPDSAPDIPEDAVIDNRVFLSVDGIGQDWKKHTTQIRDWYHGGMEDGVELELPVVGIHEGEGKSTLHDGFRIVRNAALTESLQNGWGKLEKTKAKAFRWDPSVKTIYDQLRQSLKVGREMVFMAHSGGASQVALALSLLASEPDAQWKEKISKQVRVLGTAPAAHRRDFEWAGVKEANVMITGSERDPITEFFRSEVEVKRPLSLLSFLGSGLKSSLKFLIKPGPYHQGEYIFAHNNTQNGEHRIAEFLAGSPGQDHILP